MARRQLTLDNTVAAELAGSEDSVLRELEGKLGCEVYLRGNVLTLDGLTSEIALRFTPKGTLLGSGTWRVDDIYVDPWKVV